MLMPLIFADIAAIIFFAFSADFFSLPFRHLIFFCRFSAFDTDGFFSSRYADAAAG